MHYTVHNQYIHSSYVFIICTCACPYIAIHMYMRIRAYLYDHCMTTSELRYIQWDIVVYSWYTCGTHPSNCYYYNNSNSSNNRNGINHSQRRQRNTG